TAPRPARPWRFSFAGRPMQGLLKEPWMSASWGLMLPYVAELPNACWAPLPLAEVVPWSLPVARAGEAAAAEAPTTEAATAAAARTFLITCQFPSEDTPSTGAHWSTARAPFGCSASPQRPMVRQSPDCATARVSGEFRVAVGPNG